jgi:hypothetical protein
MLLMLNHHHHPQSSGTVTRGIPRVPSIQY